MEESRRLRISVAQFDYLISLFPLVGPALLEERLKEILAFTILRSPTPIVGTRLDWGAVGDR